MFFDWLRQKVISDSLDLFPWLHFWKSYSVSAGCLSHLRTPKDRDGERLTSMAVCLRFYWVCLICSKWSLRFSSVREFNPRDFRQNVYFQSYSHSVIKKKKKVYLAPVLCHHSRFGPEQNCHTSDAWHCQALHVSLHYEPTPQVSKAASWWASTTVQHLALTLSS